MKNLLSLLFLSFGLFAQERYCVELDGYLDLSTETAKLNVGGYQFSNEYKQVKPWGAYKKFILIQDNAENTAVMELWNDIDYEYSNSVSSLKIYRANAKDVRKALNSKGEVPGIEVLYDIKQDSAYLSSIGFLKQINWVTKAEYDKYLKVKEKRKRDAEIKATNDSIRRQSFYEKTMLLDYVGVYNVKFISFGGRRLNSDFKGTLYLSEEGVSLKGDLLTGGVMRGGLNKEDSTLDFEEGVFDGEISAGLGKTFVLTINSEKSVGSVSRMTGSTQLGTITFVVEDYKP